jgi:hypothetical protein
MHLQKAVDGYEVFARSLSIGPETMVMNFDPDQPMHARYSVSHDFLDAATGDETVTIGRLVNAFFRWEFNSCETLIKDGVVYPIDYANACPDVAITSLHYYFPWAMKALVKWSVYCAVTGRRPRYDLETRRYFDIADRPDLDYGEKLAAYRKLADDYFETEHYWDFCASRLAHFDEIAAAWFAGPDFDRLLVETVRSTFPVHEQDHFVDHYRGLIALWVREADVGRLVDRPGVDGLVAVHVLDVAPQHLAQRVPAIERLPLLVDPVERLGLPFGAVLVRRAAPFDDAQQPVGDRRVNAPGGEALMGQGE